MYGAILGDIVGSRFEFSRPAGFDPKKEQLFANACFYTDDTVMTVATKYAVLRSIPYARAYGKFGRKYPRAGYGTMFKQWLDGHCERGYNSFGNGAAMRVSFIGQYFDTMEKVWEEAEKSAECTHNHPDGIRAAVATAAVIFLARSGASKKEIRRYVRENFHYNTSIPLVFRRPFCKFDITSEGTMPVALRCFLESETWEECIRNVFSVRCDTDTVGCIAGGIADAFYHGTGLDEQALLYRYLVRPDDRGKSDTFLYEWALRDPSDPEPGQTI